jgi:hypothetical protein
MYPNQWLIESDIRDLFKKAFYCLRVHSHVLLRMTFFILIPVYLIAFGASLLIKSTNVISLFGDAIIIVVTIGGQIWLTGAIIYYGLENIYNDASFSIAQTLKIATRFVSRLLSINLVILLFITSITVMVSAIVKLVFSSYSQEFHIANLFLSIIIISIFIYLRFFLAQFFLIDEECGIMESLQKSNLLFLEYKNKISKVFIILILLMLVPTLLNFYFPLSGLVIFFFLMPFTILIQLFLYIALRIHRGDIEMRESVEDE